MIRTLSFPTAVRGFDANGRRRGVRLLPGDELLLSIELRNRYGRHRRRRIADGHRRVRGCGIAGTTRIAIPFLRRRSKRPRPSILAAVVGIDIDPGGEDRETEAPPLRKLRQAGGTHRPIVVPRE